MRNSRTRFVLFGMALFVVSPVLHAQQPGTGATTPPQSAKPAGQLPAIGGFTFDKFEDVELVRRGSALELSMSGPELRISTARYELSGRKIAVSANRAASGNRLRLTRADATGSVRIVIRHANGEKDVVLCDRAIYTAAPPTPARPNDTSGQIDLKGNVRWTALGYSVFDGPTTMNAESGTIELRPNDESVVRIQKGSASGTVRESAVPKPSRTNTAPKQGR